MESSFQASEALHMVGFENFVKSICIDFLSYFKVKPSICFPNAMPDNVTATNEYYGSMGVFKRGIQMDIFLTNFSSLPWKLDN